MSIFGNMFSSGNAQQQQQQQQQQAPSQQQQAASNQQQQAGGNLQNPDVKTSESSNFPPNPLDAYAALLDNSKQQQDAPPSFNLDPAELQKISGKLSFTNGIDPELAQKAVQGDMQAFMDVMNSVARNAYMTSIQHGGALTDKFVGARTEYERKGISSEVSKQLIHNSIQVPNANHPVVKAELKRIAEMMHKQSPDASPGEIAQRAQEYFIQLSEAMGGGSTQAEQQQKQAPAEVDWDKWFDPHKQ